MEAEDLSPAEREENLEDDARGERIFAYYTSTSLTRLVTTTITAISTCLSTAEAGSPVCAGRKRRSFSDKAMQLDGVKLDNIDLSSSQTDLESWNEPGPRVSREVQNDGHDKEGRRLTIWSTAFTTLTVTSTSALAGTTVTASILCAVIGIGQSCFLG